MSATLTIEERLARLEQVVEELRQRLPDDQDRNWVDRVAGSITDVEAFDEAMALGREYRRTGKTPDAIEDGS